MSRKGREGAAWSTSDGNVPRSVLDSPLTDTSAAWSSTTFMNSSKPYIPMTKWQRKDANEESVSHSVPELRTRRRRGQTRQRTTMTPSIRTDVLSYSQICTFDFCMSTPSPDAMTASADDAKKQRKSEASTRTDWRCLKMMLMGWTITRWFRPDMVTKTDERKENGETRVRTESETREIEDWIDGSWFSIRLLRRGRASVPNGRVPNSHMHFCSLRSPLETPTESTPARRLVSCKLTRALTMMLMCRL